MDIQQVIETHQRIILADFLRYFIPTSISFLVFWVILYKRLAHRFIQRKKPESKRLWSEFNYSMSTVLIFATIGLGIFTAKKNGAFHIYNDVAEFGIGYFLLSIIGMLVFHDFYFYWTHRLMHHPKIFKHVHLIHHLSTNPSPWAAYSFHPIEAIVQALVLPIILVAIPVHGAAITIFLIYMILRNVWGHLGYELFPKSFIKIKWLNWNTTTTHHSMHHQYSSCNYALYFTWWDNWMKTTHRKYDESFEEVTTRKKATTRKNLLVTSIVMMLYFSGFAQSPNGQWMTFDERTNRPLSIIRIYENSSGDGYEGEIDSIIMAPHLIENGICSMCKGKQKNQPVIGMEILSQFELSENEWKGGEILDPETGEVYKSKIWFNGPNEISVRGYAGPFDLFYRTQKWRRFGQSNGIAGVWESIDDRFDQVRARVELEVVDNELKGYVKKIFILPHEGNYPICLACKGEFKNQPIVGMKIMKGYKRSGDRWTDGQVTDPGNGASYNSSFWLENQNTLVIRGYWGPFFRTQKWQRYSAI